MSSGPSTDSQCQDPALVPTTYSKQIPEEQAGDHPLGPKRLVLQSKDPNWDADLAGEAVTSPKDSHGVQWKERRGSNLFPQNAGRFCTPRDMASRPLGQEVSGIQSLLFLS